MFVVIILAIHFIQPVSIEGISEFITSFSSNSGILSLLIVIPLLGKPLHLGDYSSALKVVFNKYLYNDGEFILFASVLTFLLSILLNLASIPIVYQITEERAKSIDKNVFANAVLRGYLSAIYWSPNYVSVAILLDILGIKWIEMIKLGFFVSVLSLIVPNFRSLVLIKKKLKIKKKPTHHSKVNRVKWKLVIELAAVILTIIVITLLINYKLNVNITISVILTSIFFPFVWSYW